MSAWIRRAAAALSLLALCAVPAPAPAAPADIEDLLFELQMVPLDGQPPPTFALDALDGRRLSLSDFKGHVILLYFWATW